MSPTDLNHLENLNECNIHCVVWKSFKQARKLKRMVYIPETTLESDKVIFNYSNTRVSDVQKRGLSRGPKFSFYSDRFNFLHFMTFEKFRHGLKNESFYDPQCKGPYSFYSHNAITDSNLL